MGSTINAPHDLPQGRGVGIRKLGEEKSGRRDAIYVKISRCNMLFTRVIHYCMFTICV
jgi:hypothetical protein